MRRTLAALVAVLTLAAVPAFAGVADSPLPVLQAGKTTFHLYSVPGVIATACFGTYFTCSSMATVPVQVGVELFFSIGGGAANDAVTTSLSVVPGGAVTLGTSSSADPGIGMQSDVGFAGRGTARILATSKKLACTAFIADRCNDPVTFMSHLTIIAKTKQKAAN